MNKIIQGYYRLLEHIVVLSLAAMCIMVFGNVVLRFFFDSGINMSEELARFMFIWLTFIGAIVAMREGAHLGVDMVVRRLPPRLQFACVLVAQFLILACCAVLLWGLLRQHSLNVANTGMVTGISLSVVYSVAYLCAASIGVLTVVNIVKLLTGKISAVSLIPASEGE